MNAVETHTTPKYRSQSPWGAIRDVQLDQMQFLVRAARAGEVVRVKFGPARHLLVQRPEHLQRILIDNHRNYTKDTRGYRMMRLILGNGLVTSEGEFWKRQRRIAQPAFHHGRLAGFAELMVDAAEELGASWQARGGEVEVAPAMMKLTLRIVGEALLSRDVSRDADAVGDALAALLEHVNHRISHPLSFGERIPTGRNRRFARASAVLDRVVLELIEERRRSGMERPDLLGMLMMARDDDGVGMTDAQLRDEVMTIFLAGHETTAVALSWALHLLAQNPEAEARLRAELAAVLGGRRPTIEDLHALPYTDRVVKETMRLYPPVWFVSRMAVEDDHLGPHRVEAGTTVFFSPYVTHRLPDLWPAPERFDPDRFAPERLAGQHKLAYLPFLAGQRKCIGDGFAMMEARLILATLLQRVRLTEPAGAEVALEPTITLRPRGAMPMRAERAAR